MERAASSLEESAAGQSTTSLPLACPRHATSRLRRGCQASASQDGSRGVRMLLSWRWAAVLWNFLRDSLSAGVGSDGRVWAWLAGGQAQIRGDCDQGSRLANQGSPSGSGRGQRRPAFSLRECRPASCAALKTTRAIALSWRLRSPAEKHTAAWSQTRYRTWPHKKRQVSLGRKGMRRRCCSNVPRMTGRSQTKTEETGVSSGQAWCGSREKWSEKVASDINVSRLSALRWTARLGARLHRGGCLRSSAGGGYVGVKEGIGEWRTGYEAGAPFLDGDQVILCGMDWKRVFRTTLDSYWWIDCTFWPGRVDFCP